MIAALLCPGPTLPKTWRHALAQRYDLVLAVNRAIDYHRAAWLVAGDAVTFQRIRQSPTVGVLTMRRVIETWHKDGPPAGFRTCVTKAFQDLPATDGAASYPQWGSTAAITFAIERGATHVHAYGLDLAGRTEFDATPNGTIDRSDDRYRRESASLATTTAWALARGAIITRIAPENPWNRNT